MSCVLKINTKNLYSELILLRVTKAKLHKAKQREGSYNNLKFSKLKQTPCYKIFFHHAVILSTSSSLFLQKNPHHIMARTFCVCTRYVRVNKHCLSSNCPHRAFSPQRSGQCRRLSERGYVCRQFHP
jgi:hypothetical protein